MPHPCTTPTRLAGIDAADPSPTPTIRSVPSAATIDWQELRARAVEMSHRAYAPYSGVRVGAAALCADGTIVTGCNVENASTGLGICAEVNLCGHLVAAGGGRPIALSVVAGDGAPLTPCGRCRQVLHEFAGGDLVIELPRGLVTLGELFPDAFGREDVAGRTG